MEHNKKDNTDVYKFWSFYINSSSKLVRVSFP